ncbi:MAG: hypothetical protein VKS61_09060 [Candidatus Sericytochromatia bacterium]|nr:hypothetical protein [Candidatus Sericytochromatia bacterium]
MPRSSTSRKGSVLASALGLTTVFVTMIVGTMAYVSTSVANTQSNRLRASAEDAAKTGMDLILGWAEQSIDKEIILPRPWERMQDGDVIDPVKYLAEGQLSAAQRVTSLDAVTSPGQLLGGNTVRELVVGVTKTPLDRPLFVTTIKARIQQFRVSDSTPRQFRICVIGRVRRVQTGFSGTTNRTAFNRIEDNERESIIAERAVMATIGRETTSRYAALVDCDLIRNWVPGELVTGPVHINRGYVDGPGFLDDGVELSAGGTVPGLGLTWTDLRSRMDINVDGVPGNPGFRKPPAAQFSYPVFFSRVSMTEIRGHARYRNNDPDRSTGAAPICIRVNGQPWYSTTASTYTSNKHNIFRDPENAAETRYGGTVSSPFHGPKIVGEPIELPRSVRNGLAAATGMPGEFQGGNRWEQLEDGLYIPTTRFWASGAGLGDKHSAVPADSYSATFSPTGGIYIRGNVEAMRMAISADRRQSLYLFQVGNYNPSQRRLYAVLADRSTTARRLTLYAWPNSGANAVTRMYRAGGGPTSALLQFGTNNTITSILTPYVGAWTDTTNPANFALTPADTVYRRIQLAAPALGAYPFNGIIFVDCAKDDPARSGRATESVSTTTATHNPTTIQPTSGHILALGNLGNRNDGQQKTEYLIENQRAEVVSTVAWSSADATASRVGPASKLNILARGNIFIQNHLLLDGIFRSKNIGGATGANATGAQLNGASVQRGNLSSLTLGDTRDLLGLVSDQRVVMGLHAPINATRGNLGCVVMAAIAALGDPAYQPWSPSNPFHDELMRRPGFYVGSFGTEGLMQSQGFWENYWIPANAGATSGTTYVPNASGVAGQPKTGPQSRNDVGLYSAARPPDGYPGNPIYQNTGYNTQTRINPNFVPRGNLLAFGSLTQRRRGIIGAGNNSYDKDFVFDPRLLSIAPPLFPASLNIVVRTQTPFTPDDQLPDRRVPYRGGGTFQSGVQTSDPLRFMGSDSGALD